MPEEIQRELENAKRLSKTKVLKSPSKNTHHKRNNVSHKSPSTRNKSPNRNISKSSISTNAKKGRGRPRKIDKIMDNNKYGSIFDTMNTTKLLKSTTTTTIAQTKSCKKNKNIEESDKLLFTHGQQKQSDTTRHRIAVDGPGFLSPDKIDVDILNELPPDIRNQLWSDLKKTSVNFKPKLPQTNAPLSSTIAASATTLPTMPSNIDVLNEILPDIVSPSQLDSSFLKAIPEDIRSEIIEESKKVKRRKLLQLDSNKQDGTTSDYESTCINPPQLTEFQPVVGGIDQSILEALPGSIRDEILNVPKNQQANILCLTDSSSVQNIPSNNNDNMEMMLGKENSLLNKEKLVQVIPEFYGASSCEEVKSLFRRWLNEGE